MGRLWSGSMGQGGSVAVDEDDRDAMVKSDEVLGLVLGAWWQWPRRQEVFSILRNHCET